MHKKIEEIRKKIDKNNPIDINFPVAIYQYTILEEWMGACPDENALNECLSLTVPQDVMIGDILDYEEKYGTHEKLDGTPSNWGPILRLWENKKLPIQDQSENCVNLIHLILFGKCEK